MPCPLTVVLTELELVEFTNADLTKSHVASAIFRIGSDELAVMAALRRDLESMNVETRRRSPVGDRAPDIAEVRNRHGLSQREFADLLGIELRTLQNWEQGRNRPDDAALSLVLMFDRAPEFVEE